MRSPIRWTRLAALGVATLMLGAGSAWAGFVGQDDFNDNLVDPSKWGTDTQVDVGAFNETNGRLEYTASGQTAFSGARRPWVLNAGSYTQSWSVQLDAHVSLGLIGLQLMKTGAIQSQSNLSLVHNPAQGVHRVIGDVVQDIGNLNGRATGQQTTLAEDVSLRLVFDAATKTLSLQYDGNGALGGYAWVELTAADIDSPTHTWGMNDASTFDVWIVGSSLAPVASGQAYADNFVASVPVPGTLGLAGLAFVGLLGWRARGGPRRHHVTDLESIACRDGSVEGPR